ncbi:MAG: branched-chain amino acid ABC transporter substrate-binding protein, partial [Caldilineae bacterium]
MHRRTRVPLFVTVLILLALLLAACPAPQTAAPSGGGGEEAAPAQEEAAPAAQEEAGEPIKIGAIFDLTGPTSDVGKPYAEGVQAYVAWANENGGINGRPIELISQDYAYDVATAEQLYSQFVEEGAVVFMGWGTGDTEALRSRIAADEVPFMSASYSANLNDMEQAPYNFLVGTTYSDQLIIAMRHALNDWQGQGNEGAPKIAVFHHDSPFGRSPIPDGEAFAAENGIEMTSIAMPRGSTDLTPELTQAQSFGANYIIIQNVSSPAALLLKDKQRLGMDDVQVICLNWCADENLINLSEGAAEGVLGTLPFAPPTEDVPGLQVVREYAASQGEDLNELGLHYGQGWWTMA